MKDLNRLRGKEKPTVWYSLPLILVWMLRKTNIVRSGL